MEIWKDVIGYEGVYEVSNLGNVKSLFRKIKNGKDSFQYKKEKLMAKANRRGYLYCGLSKNKFKKHYLIHRLVAIAFIPNPETKPQVNHIDGNKLNNDLINLEWCSIRENITHCNQTRDLSSKYIGVAFNKRANKWQSSIKINGENYYLGLFKSEIEASMAYKNILNNKGIINKYAV